MDFLQEWVTNNQERVDKLVATVVMVGVVLVVRWLALRWVERAKIQQADIRRRWMVQIRNLCFALLAFGLVVIWATQLKNLALSLVAVLLGLVLATKELIACMSGGFMKASSRAFTVGDRIAVGQVRGDVIDQTVFTTTVMELDARGSGDQHTGRSVVVPNSLFLTESIHNESFTEPYEFHTFDVPVKSDEDWEEAERVLLGAAETVCGGYLEDARQHIERYRARHGLDVVPADPSVTVTLTEPGRMDLMVRVPAPAGSRGSIEQQIVRRFLREFRWGEGLEEREREE